MNIKPLIISLRLAKKIAILAAMKQLNGNVPLAAEKLRIGRSTLYRKLKEYGRRQAMHRKKKKNKTCAPHTSALQPDKKRAAVTTLDRSRKK